MKIAPQRASRRSAAHGPAHGVALLGVLLALAGGLELHPFEAGHALALGSDRVYVCAGGEPQALHVEAAQALERAHCPGCLHRLQSAAAEASDSGRFGALAPGLVATLRSPVFLTAGSPSPIRPRAPPLS